MDQVVAGVVVIALLGAVVVVAVAASRGGFRGDVRGPGGVGASVEGERARQGVRIRRVRAGRNVEGRGPSVDAQRVDAGQDAIFEQRPEQDPKG